MLDRITHIGRVNKIESLFNIIGNYFFPLVLSCFLIWRLDYFFNQIIKNQKDFQDHMVMEIVQIKQDLRDMRLEVVKK
ncbi:unnamed protein product [marine sediment metagenome]|uniref:Uncharacterized protein n=1 Tax=marine sediment metagenome TaxID=412755 RepID=X1K4V2_9ZZZZ